jgi:hypothetical protein
LRRAALPYRKNGQQFSFSLSQHNDGKAKNEASCEKAIRLFLLSHHKREKEQQIHRRVATIHLLGGGDLVDAAEVLLEGTVRGDELNVGTVELGDRTLLDVLGTGEGGETPLLRDDDLLATGELQEGKRLSVRRREKEGKGRKQKGMKRMGGTRVRRGNERTHLVLGATESLEDNSLVRVLATDGKDDLANVDTGDLTDGVTPGTTHTGRQPIGTGAREGLVGTDDVVGVGADPQVERVLAGGLDDVLVGANTGGLEGLGRELLVLVGDEVSAVEEGKRQFSFPHFLRFGSGGEEGETHQKGKSSTEAFLRPCVREKVLCKQSGGEEWRLQAGRTNEVEDADLGVGDTTVVPTLRVGLVLAL